MSSDTPAPHVGVIVAFLGRLDEDLASGRRLPVDHYEALFPGFEKVVAREYHRVLSHEVGSGPATSPDAEPTIEPMERMAARDVERQRCVAPLPERIGRYAISRLLGQGGQGLVYLGRDEDLGRNVAIKQMTHGGFSDAQLARFEREAAVVARLDHPDIAPLLEAGRDAGVPFLAMKFVEGRTLGDVLRERADQPFSARADWALPLLARLARAVHAAHEAGVIHRDLKPGNVMVTPAGSPVLLDFGLARDIGSETPELTQTGDVFGSPPYMAPEQFLGQRTDRRVDVYALGVTAHECLSGRRPFTAATRQALMELVLSAEAPQLRSVAPEASRDLGAILETALSKEPDRRYATAADLADDLESASKGRPVSVRPLGALGRASRWTKRHPARASAITALVVFGLAVAGLSGFLVARWDELTAGEIALADQKYQRALERAYLDIGEGSPAEAIGALRQLTAARPSDPHALAGLMMAHLEAGRPEDAQALLDALPTELRPTFRPLADWTARRLGREPSQATAGASTALSSFLEASTALLRFHAGDRDAANVALAKATEAITRSQTVPAIFAFTRTHAAAHAGEERSACEAAETVVTHWPGSGTAWYWRGLALAAHDPEQSREAFRRAIALEPDLGAAYHDLGKLESDLGRNAEALPSFERAVTLLPKVAQVHSSLAGCLAELSKNREAETAYARAAELDPNDAEIAVGRCALWHREGRHEEARIEARRATKLAPTNVRAWFDLAVVLGSLGQREEAVTAWKQAAAIAPHDPEIARHLGTSLIAADRREEGLKFLADQAARFPQDPRLAFALGNALFESRRSNDALPHLVRASSEAPAVLEHRLRLSDALLAKGDIEGADRELDAALTLAPASADAWMKRGAVRLKQRRMLEAESCFDEALRHSDGNPRSIALHAQVVAPLRPYFDVLRRAEAAAAGTDPLPDTETLTTFFALARKIEHHRHYVALWRRLIEERAIDRPAGPSELASDAILSAALCALGPRPAPGESLSAAGRQQALGLATLWLSDELARWAADVVQSASRASAARTALERLDRALPDRDPAIDGTAELDDSDWQIQRARLRSRVDEL